VTDTQHQHQPHTDDEPTGFDGTAPTPTPEEVERDQAWLAGGISEFTHPHWRNR
jgi:hypothetical protein